MSEKLEYIVRSLSKGTTKKYETYVVNSIFNKLNSFDIEFATQQTVITNSGNKYIDMYFPQINFGIEIDEWYHQNDIQVLRDNERVKDITDALLNSLGLGKRIVIKRISIPENPNIEDLDNAITEAVQMIKEKVGKNPQWVIDEKKAIETIITRGYLQRGDSLSGMVSILKLFGKEVKGWQHCTYYPNKDSDRYVWSPTLSVELKNDEGSYNTNHYGWINTISDDLTKIYESASDGRMNMENEHKRHSQLNTERFVFLKYKDALGNNKRRFLGTYESVGYDDIKKAEIWECVSEQCPLIVAK